MRRQNSLKIHSHSDLSEDGAIAELHPQLTPVEVHSSFPEHAACNLGLVLGKDFLSLLVYAAAHCEARLHFVFVNRLHVGLREHHKEHKGREARDGRARSAFHI